MERTPPTASSRPVFRAAWLVLSLIVILGGLLVSAQRAVAADTASPTARLNSALALLESQPATRHQRATLDANHVAYHFVDLENGVYARYNVATRIVQIDSDWSDVDTVTLAAVIAHEAVHVEDAVNGNLGAGGACIDSEIRAFHVAAHFWTAIYGPNGKLNAQNDLEQQLNLVVQQEHQSPAALELMIRQAYTEQCGTD